MGCLQLKLLQIFSSVLANVPPVALHRPCFRLNRCWIFMSRIRVYRGCNFGSEGFGRDLMHDLSPRVRSGWGVINAIRHVCSGHTLWECGLRKKIFEFILWDDELTWIGIVVDKEIASYIVLMIYNNGETTVKLLNMRDNHDWVASGLWSTGFTFQFRNRNIWIEWVLTHWWSKITMKLSCKRPSFHRYQL